MGAPAADAEEIRAHSPLRAMHRAGYWSGTGESRFSDPGLDSINEDRS